MVGWQPSISKRGEDWSNPFSFLCRPHAFFAAIHLRMRVIHGTVADCSRHRRSTWQPIWHVGPILNVCRAAYSNLFRIAKIRTSLTTAACKTLVHSLVTSWLHYGNAVLYGISDRLLHRLEMAQRSAARVVLRIRRGDRRSMTAVLEQLHWQPVRYRLTALCRQQTRLWQRSGVQCLRLSRLFGKSLLTAANAWRWLFNISDK